MRATKTNLGLACALAALSLHAACSDTGAGNGGNGGTPGDGTSGIDVSTYATSGPVGVSGGTVAIVGGPSVTVPAWTLSTEADVGLRPAKSAPSMPSGWTKVSGWFDVGATRSDLTADPASPVVIRIPITPPSEALDHPGLQVLVAIRGIVVPVDGTYDAFTGEFVAELLSVPPAFTFSVAFNPNVRRLHSTDGLLYSISASKTSALGDTWPTLEWRIDYDSQTLTEDEAKSVLSWGRQAAAEYSGAGFKSPLLYNVLEPTDMRFWHVNLIATGSHYKQPEDTQSADAARKLGRINLAVDDVRQPTTNPYGGGYAILAHELFHSIFEAYQIPKTCFNYTENGVVWCYESNTGFNEGLATAVAYQMEQGQAIPRPSPSATTLEAPHGWFDTGNSSAAYQNQDFYVYLLRMSGLDTVRQYLLALASASVGTPASAAESLEPYAIALETASIGFPATFHEVYAAYAADRAYIRTSAGYVWPDEPDAEFPGKANMLARSLFPSAYDLKGSDCVVSETDAVCTVTLKDVPPLSARVLLADWVSKDQMPTGTQVAGLKAKFKAETSKGQVSIFVFGENYGESADEARIGSYDGSEVELKDVAQKWTNGKVLLVQGGGGPATITVTMTYSASDLSEICQAAQDWMCQCKSAGPQMGCMVYKVTINQICANIPADQSCDETCGSMGISYAEAYGAEDPSMWNAMCPNAPK
jgi:hypothetical protein